MSIKEGMEKKGGLSYKLAKGDLLWLLTCERCAPTLQAHSGAETKWRLCVSAYVSAIDQKGVLSCWVAFRDGRTDRGFQGIELCCLAGSRRSRSGEEQTREVKLEPPDTVTPVQFFFFRPNILKVFLFRPSPSCLHRISHSAVIISNWRILGLIAWREAASVPPAPAVHTHFSLDWRDSCETPLGAQTKRI